MTSAARLTVELQSAACKVSIGPQTTDMIKNQTIGDA